MLPLLAGSLALAVSSEPAPSWLRWDAPGSCPDLPYVERAVVERLGHPPAAASIAVRVEVVEDGYGLHLDLTDDGERRAYALRDGDCWALADAAALLAAVHIDVLAASELVLSPKPVPVVEPVVAAPAPPVEPLPPPKPIPDAPQEAVARRPPPVPTSSLDHVALAVLGGAEWGGLPSGTLGGRVRLGLLWPRWRVEVGGSYFAPRVARTADGAARVRMGFADARGCWRAGGARVEAPLCAGAEVGAGFAEGLQDPGRRNARGWWLAAALSAGVRGALTARLGLIARAELAVPAVRTAYDVRDPGEPVGVFTPGVVSGRLWLGLEAKIWSPR